MNIRKMYKKTYNMNIYKEIYNENKTSRNINIKYITKILIFSTFQQSETSIIVLPKIIFLR